MAELRPYPFAALLTRMLRELEEKRSVFDLPERKFFLGAPSHDFSVHLHGFRASSPLGPAAGPHTQLAQNIVLCWLAGCRVMELKTVQVKDDLEIPRPCIDMQTVGYNVEWSQELRLEQSLAEYVKAAMLICIVRASGLVEIDPGYGDALFDMSVGYDLAGIKSERVRAFLEGMLDCRSVVDELRRQIPETYGRYRSLDFPTRLSQTLTLSTFHGCPPNEIERIIEFLLEIYDLNCVIKLNPTLLGKERANALLKQHMGYQEVEIPSSAFDNDSDWDQATGFIERLRQRAQGLDLGLGVKFSNTLLVRNHRHFFPASEKEMYLSGPPLHVLAMNLVHRLRQHFGDKVPVSFSAGVDRQNFPDAVALGLVPVTVCTDLLQPGGYGRVGRYFGELQGRMDQVGASTVGDYIIRAYGHGAAALEQLQLPGDDPRLAACQRAFSGNTSLADAAGEQLYQRWVSRTRLLNTEDYVPRATALQRYGQARTCKTPRKVGNQLTLFDCLACDKCVPVCPNNANFSFVLPVQQIPVVKVRRQGDGWYHNTEGTISTQAKRQYGNFADLCNECGNCDIFCPEDGGPYVEKPRFFGSLTDWEHFAEHDGFCVEKVDGAEVMYGRIKGQERRLELSGTQARFTGEGFNLTLDVDDPLATLRGEAAAEVDLSELEIMRRLRDAVYGSQVINALSSLLLVET